MLQQESRPKQEIGAIPVHDTINAKIRSDDSSEPKPVHPLKDTTQELLSKDNAHAEATCSASSTKSDDSRSKASPQQLVLTISNALQAFLRGLDIDPQPREAADAAEGIYLKVSNAHRAVKTLPGITWSLRDQQDELQYLNAKIEWNQNLLRGMGEP